MDRPVDYSVTAETPAEHLRNALQLLRAETQPSALKPSWSSLPTATLDAARTRVHLALVLLERKRDPDPLEGERFDQPRHQP
jgi:hypothetical protein